MNPRKKTNKPHSAAPKKSATKRTERKAAARKVVKTAKHRKVVKNTARRTAKKALPKKAVRKKATKKVSTRKSARTSTKQAASRLRIYAAPIVRTMTVTTTRFAGASVPEISVYSTDPVTKEPTGEGAPVVLDPSGKGTFPATKGAVSVMVVAFSGPNGAYITLQVTYPLDAGISEAASKRGKDPDTTIREDSDGHMEFALYVPDEGVLK